MFSWESKLRVWGRSLGTVIPKGAVLSERLRAGDTVKLIVLKKSNALRRTFGSAKLRKPTEMLLKEADEALWNG